MIEPIPFDENERVVGYRIDGRISAEDMERAAEALERKLDAHDKLRVYAEVESIGSMEPEAFLRDMRFTLKHFRRFEREAVVTDLGWLRRLTTLISAVLPESLKVKAFASDERDLARDWITR